MKEVETEYLSATFSGLLSALADLQNSQTSQEKESVYRAIARVSNELQLLLFQVEEQGREREG